MPTSNFLPINGGTRPVMDRWHYEVHEGCVYEWHYENRALASSGTVNIHILTGSESMHNEISFHVLGGSLAIQMYEGVTVATAGTTIATNNRNRNFSASTASATLQHDPTVTTVGTTLISTRLLLGSTGQTTETTTAIAGDAERIFKPSTNYIIRLTAIGAVSCTADGIFYEEEV